jgi:hypothetical protein
MGPATPLSLSLTKGPFAIREWRMNLEMMLKPGANSSVANQLDKAAPVLDIGRNVFSRTRRCGFKSRADD